ncbi:MAG: hypothetical protein PHT92_06180 [Bacteroidales bacterium]|nr:hypothetical protein [Bacteroidales bacterium]MDY0254424.1 hypothetical protein [Tenuifilaceae bacterium]
MKKTKDILTIILSGYLLLAMGGFSIFHHLCNCTAESKSSTSLLVEQSCCTANSAEPIACHSETNTSSCGASECDDCSCETEVEVLETDETTAIESKRITSTRSTLLIAILFEDFLATNESNPKVPVAAKDISPPQSGKSIVISNHSLKIAHFVS